MRILHHFGILSGWLLLSSATLASTAALADSASNVRTLNISYVKADLNDPAAAKALYTRIQRAARLVCESPAAGEINRYRQFESCYQRAVNAAVADVGATALTAVHHRRTQAEG